MYKKIVTHPGDAHRDEFLACCFLLGSLSDGDAAKIEIERRNPTEEDLCDPRVLVLDQGRLLEPISLNFDHHQLPREAEPTCSLTLVLQMSGANLELTRKIFPWLRFTEILDSKGPTVAAAHLGCSRDAMLQTMSPIEVTVLRKFQAKTKLNAWDPLFVFMYELGSEKLRYLRDVEWRLRNLLSFGRWHELGDVTVFDATHVDPKADPTMGLELFLQDQPQEAAVTLTRENPDRGDGFVLFRRNDHPRIDFSRVEKDPRVRFAHKQGFLAATEGGLETWQLLDIVTNAIVPAQA